MKTNGGYRMQTYGRVKMNNDACVISAQCHQIIVAPPVKGLRGARPLTEETSQNSSTGSESSQCPRDIHDTF